MRSFGFLLSRRWLLFAVAVALLVALAWRLGVWQFDRLSEREDTNAVVARNVDADPVPADQVLAVGEPVADDERWRRVTATGEYDESNTVVIRYRTREGRPGADIVVPLLTQDGPALLVDRGWLPTANRGAGVDDVPAPPGGEVTVTGWVRADDTGDATTVTDGGARSISSVAISEALGLEVYGGFVDLESESPPPARPLDPAPLPDLGEGPHFFYGLQWWFFAALAVFGFCYLLYDEWRGPRPRRGRRDTPRSERSHRSAVDRPHGAGDVARRG